MLPTAFINSVLSLCNSFFLMWLKTKKKKTIVYTKVCYESHIRYKMIYAFIFRENFHHKNRFCIVEFDPTKILKKATTIYRTIST
jgi:hypothetical protein